MDVSFCKGALVSSPGPEQSEPSAGSAPKRFLEVPNAVGSLCTLGFLLGLQRVFVSHVRRRAGVLWTGSGGHETNAVLGAQRQLAWWLWASGFASWGLTFPICKMELSVPTFVVNEF